MMKSEREILANLEAMRFSVQLETWVKKNLYADFTLTYTFDWSPKRRASRGGIYKNGPGINIAMLGAVPNSLGYTYRFKEYASYDSDRIIGGFYSKDPYDKLRAIISHEVAHAIQFFTYSKLNTSCKPHGPMFKKYYKMLRVEFINSTLPKQAPLEADYTNYISNSFKV